MPASLNHPCTWCSDRTVMSWVGVVGTLLALAVNSPRADRFSLGPQGHIVRTPDHRRDVNANMNLREQDNDPTSFFGVAAEWSEEDSIVYSSSDSASISDVEDYHGSDRAVGTGSTPGRPSENGSRKSPSDERGSAGPVPADSVASMGRSRMYSLAKISPTHFFYLTPKGQLLERFFNGHRWTYHAHPPPYPGATLTALSAVANIEDRETTLHYIGCIYASDSEGRLFRAVQRRFFNSVVGGGTGSWRLDWSDVSWGDYRIFSGGVLGVGQFSRKMYFADADGRLVAHTIKPPPVVARRQLMSAMSELNLTTGTPSNGSKGAAEVHREESEKTSTVNKQHNDVWRSHGSPPGSGIAVVATALSTSPFSVFSITVDGMLAEWRPPERSSSNERDSDDKNMMRMWSIHPRPRSRIYLSLLPSTLVLQNVVHSYDQPRTQITLLLTGDDGSVWARQGYFGNYEWERQRKAPFPVMSAPSNTIVQPHVVSTFFVGSNGSLMERRYRLSNSRWLWTSYGHPDGLPLINARPLVLSSSEVACQTLSGATASLVRWNGKWSWRKNIGPDLFLLNSTMSNESVSDLHWLSSLQMRFREQARSRNSSSHSRRLRILEKRLEADNLTADKLCEFDSYSINTCGLRRDPLAFTSLPPHMVNMDGLQAIGLKLNSFLEKDLRFTMIHRELIGYVDVYGRVNHHQIVQPTDGTEGGAEKTKVRDALKLIGLNHKAIVDSMNQPSIFHDARGRFVENVSRARILPTPINFTDVYMPSDSYQTAKWPLPMSSSFIMGELLSTSIFSLSPSGSVFERFYNGANWVYVRHELPGPRRLIAVTAVASHGTIFVSDERGQLFQRISPGLDRPLAWKRVLPGHSIETGGVTGSDMRHGVRVFFVDSSHKIVAYSVHRRNSTIYEGNGDELIDCESNEGQLWVSDLMEAETLQNKVASENGGSVKTATDDDDGYGDDDDDEFYMTAFPVVMTDAFSLLTGSLFAIDKYGQLIEHARSERLWINHGHPSEGVPLSFGRGVVVRDVHPNRVGSIFLRGTDGNLYERWWDASIGSWRWMDHGHPENTFVASAPGALHESREMYVVGGDAHLWSRAFMDGSWTWVDRGMPSSPLSVVAPIKVGGHSVMVMTLDGKLASLKADSHVKHQNVGWHEFEGPEPVSKGAPPLGRYCSDDRRSPWNCIQAGNPANDQDQIETGRFSSRAERTAIMESRKMPVDGGTDVLYMSLGAFGVKLDDFSFFFDRDGNLDIGGNRDLNVGTVKKNQKTNSNMPSDWLKLNQYDGDKRQRSAQDTFWIWEISLYVLIVLVVYSLHYGNVPLVNIKLPFKCVFEIKKCQCSVTRVRKRR